MIEYPVRLQVYMASGVDPAAIADPHLSEGG